MHFGKSAQCTLVPVYVAARSLRSLRSNKFDFSSTNCDSGMFIAFFDNFILCIFYFFVHFIPSTVVIVAFA